MNGILNINKPKGMTSHDVVNRVRRILKIKKVGHTGTLDPIAEGVLPLTIGNATKISSFIVDKDKEYIVECKFGIKTDTYDLTGEEIAKSEKKITRKEIEKVIPEFLGDIEQVPPIYSAIKISGKKLYEYAREGISVEIPSRRVRIYDISIQYFDFPFIKLKISCSKGTYIRSICNDLGEKLGVYGHMTSLIRSATGNFTLDDAINLESLEKLDLKEIEKLLKPIDFPLGHLKKLDVRPSSSKYLLNGNILIQKNIIQDLQTLEDEEKVRLYLEDKFIGIGEYRRQKHDVKPLRLINLQ